MPDDTYEYLMRSPQMGPCTRFAELHRESETTSPERPLEVGVGIARGPLDARSRDLARKLTFSIGPVDDGPEVVGVGDVEGARARLEEAIAKTRYSATTCAHVLQLVAQLEPSEGIIAESLAYSALLGGDEFRRWRASTPIRDRPPSDGAIRAERVDDVLHITLNRPERRNALDAQARGDLSDALDVAVADPSLTVQLRGEGPSFCAGGDVAEFGMAGDHARAHALRVGRGPTLRMLTTGPRVTAFVHGAVVGAGLELAAFAGHVCAAAGTTFTLPEVAMGLIPGAGGTVSVTRRIGRWRAAWMMLSGETVHAPRALEWGLVDHVS